MREKTIYFEQLNNPELIQEIVAGNEQAVLYLLLDKCGSRLKFLCDYKFKALEMEFPELVNDTYEILRHNNWKALRNFRGENQQGQKCKIENYISVIVSRYLLKRLNEFLKENSQKSPLINIENDINIHTDDDQKRLAQEILETILELENTREKDVLLLYKLDGYSVEEVSKLMKISPANVYTICSRAMVHLKAALERKGIHG